LHRPPVDDDGDMFLAMPIKTIAPPQVVVTAWSSPPR
jgi:hypothetical protein